MTRYNDVEHIANWDYGDDGTREPDDYAESVFCYQDGVDRVLEYIMSINAYPKLIAELKWAIDEGLSDVHCGWSGLVPVLLSGDDF